MICRILLAAALAFACHAQAQDYPAKPVRVIVPFVPGGGVDVVQRIVAEKLSAKWGQPVIVENRAGAAGNIGAEVVFRAPPDGYTLLSAPPGPLAINKHLYNTIGYDPDAFVPVSVLVLSPNMLLVSPKAGIQSVQELVALAKASPDRLNYSSQGSGSTSHLTAELFKSMAGVGITHIPYKGSAPADMAVISGEVALTFDNVGASLRYVRAGQLKALAVTSERRLASLPDVPAMAEVIPGLALLQKS